MLLQLSGPLVVAAFGYAPESGGASSAPESVAAAAAQACSKAKPDPYPYPYPDPDYDYHYHRPSSMARSMHRPLSIGSTC